MTDTEFNETERLWLTERGFTCGDTTAEIAGPMTVNAVPHGHHHFRFSITLPGGEVVSGFAAKSKLLATGGEDGAMNEHKACVQDEMRR